MIVTDPTAQRESARSARLGNSANNSSGDDGKKGRRRIRLDRRAGVQTVTDLDRLKNCGVVPYGAAVTLRLHEGQAGVAGVQSCGSVWACPVCSAKILSRRHEELGRGLAEWEANGGQIVMATFTMRHNKGHRLSTLWEALSYAWAGVTSGRRWVAEKAEYGIRGMFRAVEVTHTANGWHVHVHAFLLVKNEGRRLRTSELRPLRSGMFSRWVARLEKRGLTALEGVQDVRVMDNAAAEVAAYVTKNVDNGDAIAREAVWGQGKKGRGSSSRTPFDILDDLIRWGEYEDVRLWHEWESVSRGKRQLTYAKGTRDLLGLGVEQTDEEIADEELADETADAVVIEGHDWMRFARHGGVIGDVLDALEDEGPDAAIRLLAFYGIRAWKAELKPSRTDPTHA